MKTTIRKLMLGTVAALVIATGPTLAAEPETPAGAMGMKAAALVFAFTFLHGADIEFFESDYGWTEARLYNKKNDLWLRQNKDDPCLFDLGRTITGDSVDPMGEHVASVRFNKLSGEIETQSRTTNWYGAIDTSYDLAMLGAPSSVCSTVGNGGFGHMVVGKESCYNGLTVNSLTPENYLRLRRALSYIFSNVCKPAELPF